MKTGNPFFMRKRPFSNDFLTLRRMWTMCHEGTRRGTHRRFLVSLTTVLTTGLTRVIDKIARHGTSDGSVGRVMTAFLGVSPSHCDPNREIRPFLAVGAGRGYLSSCAKSFT